MLRSLAAGFVLAALAGSALAGVQPALARWGAPEKDPVLARLELSAKQKTGLAGVFKAYMTRRAEIEKRYEKVRMAMLRRQMYKDLMECDTEYAAKFRALLAAAQRMKLAAGDAVVAKCAAEVEKARQELAEAVELQRSDIKKYAALKARVDKRVDQLQAERDKQLDARVGKLPAAGKKG